MKQPVDEVIKMFYEFVGDSILVGHNIKSSDLRYITKAAKKAGIHFDVPYLDTYLLAKKFENNQGWEKVNLGYLAQKYGFEHKEAHRAWSDAEVNAEVYFECVAEYLSEKGFIFEGEVSYCSLSTGNEYEEKFKSDGKKLIIVDEHECRHCSKTVTSKTGINYSNGYGANEWYCKDCLKEKLIEMITEKIEDEELDENDYIPQGKSIDELSLKILFKILDEIEPDTHYFD